MKVRAAAVEKTAPAPDQATGRAGSLCGCPVGQGTPCGRRKEAGKSTACPSSSSRTVLRNSFMGFVETTGGIEPPAVFALKLRPAQ